MQGKYLIENMLDLLVDMSNHCTMMVGSRDVSKCSNCALGWNFNIANHGCFLVETITNSDKFMDDLIDMCKYSGVEYKDRLRTVASVFVTEYE